jgi:Flp pilus assembly protein TadG
MRKIQNRPRSERGATMVEFALILPVMAMVTFGMMTGAIAYNHKMDLTHAAREGARYGATVPLAQCIPTTNCGGTWADLVQSVVAERSFGDVTATDPQVCVALVTGTNSIVAASYSTDGTTCYDDGGADTSNRVHVKVTRTGDELNGIFFRIPVTLTTQASAKFEQ